MKTDTFDLARSMMREENNIKCKPMMKRTYLIGNWKMHGSLSQVDAFFATLLEKNEKITALQQVEKVICPPFTYLSQIANYRCSLPAIKLGAQDLSSEKQGPYTGQIAASMLVEQGCEYVIVGHSERRQWLGETNEKVAAKFLAAKSVKLTPILCVGETQAQQAAGLTETIVLEQLQAVLSQGGIDNFRGAMVAYEPIWAIGTGLSATPLQAQAVHHLIRETLGKYDSSVAAALPLLYGGSVKPDNAKALFSMLDIDGALVGGASLQPLDFLTLCEEASL